jgi:hypothetical protein
VVDVALVPVVVVELADAAPVDDAVVVGEAAPFEVPSSPQPATATTPSPPKRPSIRRRLGSWNGSLLIAMAPGRCRAGRSVVGHSLVPHGEERLRGR